MKEKVHIKADFMGTNNIDQGNVNQEPQRIEEEAQIEDFDRVSKKIEHPVDLTVMPLPENPIGSSEIKIIVLVVSHKDQVANVPTLTSSSEGIKDGYLKSVVCYRANNRSIYWSYHTSEINSYIRIRDTSNVLLHGGNDRLMFPTYVMQLQIERKDISFCD